MKKIFLSAFLVFLLVTPVFAEANSLPAVSEVELPSPGLTPDNPFYFLKEWKESIQTFFTFGAENQAKQFLHLADVRLAEYQKMIEAGKTDIAEKTLAKYGDQLNRALEKAKEVKAEGVEKLKEAISEKILSHEETLQKTLEKVPEWAKEGIKNAIEVSRQGFENAIGTISEEKKGELEKRAEEIKLKVEEKLGIVEKPPTSVGEPGPSFVPTSSVAVPVCIQVITPATSPDGTCKEFPTPCDVPSDWKKVDKCSSISAPSAPSTPPKPPISSEPTPTEIRYYTCPDGTKVESGRCFAGGGCSMLVSPENQCPQQTPPVSRGTECLTAGEIKYFKCADGTQIPWCMCGPEGSFAGAKNAWQCQYYPIGFTCQKQTVTSSPTLPQTSFTPPQQISPAATLECKGGTMDDYQCSDGTLIKWQCKCRDIGEQSEEARYCIVTPAESCSASVNASPLAITWIMTRYIGWIGEHIFWTTNVPANSYVEYGPTTSYGFTAGYTASPVSPTTQHGTNALEEARQRDTTYHFRIVAQDAKGNKFISQDYTFTTSP